MGLLLPASALASYEQVASSSELLQEAGNGVAVNETGAGGVPPGTVYLAGGGGRDVLRYSPTGQLQESWGYFVVKSGPDKAGTSKVQQLTVNATAGHYKLEVAGVEGGSNFVEVQATAPATGPGSVQAALEATPEALGNVEVSGGPGDAAGSAPYTIAFKGALADDPYVEVGAVDVNLSGGSPSSSVSVSTLVPGAFAFDRCFPANGDVCFEHGDEHGEGPGQLRHPTGIAVDQATGDVYVLDPGRSNDVIQVFGPEGEYLAGFGQVSAEPLAASPDKIHSTGGIAVDQSGDVYLSDSPLNKAAESRVMVFSPHEGHLTEYEYAPGRDLATGYSPGALALDSAGDLYLVARSERIDKFTPAEPTHPAWEFAFPPREVGDLTVDPQTGEAFFFSSREKGRFHRLDAQGAEVESFAPALQPNGGAGLAFDAALAFEPGRPPGTLFASVEGAASNAGHPRLLAFAQPVSHPPTVDAGAFSSVGTSSAHLSAQVDPHGFQTTYRFQYLTQRSYEENLADSLPGFQGAAESPPGGAILGTGNVDLTAATDLSGLAPATAYRFRLLAENQFAAGPAAIAGPELQLTTYPVLPAGLPDHRAYELVSPPAKAGGEVLPLDPFHQSCAHFLCPQPGELEQVMPVQSSPDGDSVVYEGYPFCAGAATAICPPGTGAAVDNEYLSARDPGGAWRTHDLSPALAISGGPNFGYKAFSEDLSRALLAQVSPALSPEAPAGYPDLYAQPTAAPAALAPLLAFPPSLTPGEFSLTYQGASTDLSRVVFAANDALTTEVPAIAPEPQPGEANLYESHAGALSLLGVLPGNAALATNPSFAAISADGSHVFFESAGRLYARIDGERTVEIEDPGHYLSATPDGSRVLLSDGCLYSLAAAECEAQLSPGHQAEFLGILGSSTDLSSVYFVDTAVLAPGENEHHESAQPGHDNLYLYSGGTTTYLATLLPGDDANDSGSLFGPSNDQGNSGDWNLSPSRRTAQVTPDGRFLAFDSAAPLTGSPAGFQVYEYDSAAARLICASCNPTGALPLGPSTLPLSEPSQLFNSFPQPRALSGSGRLFFDSEDSLLPADTNAGRRDVYEWEPQGVGSCESESLNRGCLSLISSGHSSSDAEFSAADPSGDNVFFTARDRLVPADTDDALDLYDARVGGGQAQAEAPASACQGSACQHPTEAPTDPTPSSSNYEGPGNLEEESAAPCKKGFVKKHGHCVKKHHKHHKRSHHRAANTDRRAHR